MTTRWDFKMSDDFQLTATPKIEEMMSFVQKASRELQEKIMEHEEQLILSCVSKEGLQRLINLCTAELEKRK